MNQRKRVSFRILAFLLIMAMLSGTLTVVCAIEGIYHEPTGWDDLYGGTQATTVSGIRVTPSRGKRCT